jgi:RNA polymerase sigma-70 factor (ECF subfamily)
MHDDATWLAGLRDGDDGAFELLLQQFEGPLYRYFLASHGDAQLAGEQSADCFGDLVPAMKKMTGGPEALRAFVFGVARNVMRRTWRRAKTRPLPLDNAADRVDERPSPVTAVGDRDELDRLFQALNDLDQSTRVVFVLAYIEQFSLNEVAELTGEPIGTVKSRIHRGRQRLSELLESNTRP